MTIYVLQLEEGKYYVGYTDAPLQQRIDQHRRGVGSSWTRLYRPLCLMEEIPTSDRSQETVVTVDYMERFGIDNVRGGIYSMVTLSAHDIDTINRHHCNNNNLCIRCGRSGHYINQCHEATHSDGSIIVDSNDDERYDTTTRSIGNQAHGCSRFDRTSHNCTANRYHMNGDSIDDNDDEDDDNDEDDDDDDEEDEEDDDDDDDDDDEDDDDDDDDSGEYSD